jgi:hypothetical protein
MAIKKIVVLTIEALGLAVSIGFVFLATLGVDFHGRAPWSR